MKEISKEQLVKRIKIFEDKGWTSTNKSDRSHTRISAYSPGKTSQKYWNEYYIQEELNNLGRLSPETRNAKRYINLIKVHYKKYPEEWAKVL